jgi:hypothetical protein
MSRRTSESTSGGQSGDRHHPGPDGDRRQVVRRRPLPSGRAFVGGLVVALAMLAAFSTAQLDGAVALAPLAAGDIVERTSVSMNASGRIGAQLSFPVDRERALDGDLEVGEPLDVLATYGTGDSARTVVVAHGVRLVDLDDSHQGLEGSGKLVVTVELGEPDQVLAVTHATDVAMITLVRPTGANH